MMTSGATQSGEPGRSRTGWRHVVVEIVDQVYAGGAGAPPGSLGQLFTMLDSMRAGGAAKADLAHVERVTLGLHRLQGLLRTTGKGSIDAVTARASLQRATVAWMRDAPLSAFA